MTQATTQKPSNQPRFNMFTSISVSFLAWQSCSWNDYSSLLPPLTPSSIYGLNCFRFSHPVDALVMFHAAEIGPSEKFGKREQPFSESGFCEKGVGEDETSNGSESHAAEEDTTEVCTFCSKVSFPHFIVPFWSKQLTSCCSAYQTQKGPIGPTSFSLSSVMGNIRLHSKLASAIC